MNMDELKLEIKKIIISSLELEDVKPENIVDSEPLFGRSSCQSWSANRQLWYCQNKCTFNRKMEILCVFSKYFLSEK